MKQNSDQVLAKQLLEAREHDNRFTFKRYLRQNTRIYFIFFCYWALPLIASSLLQMWVPFWIIVGCIAGSLQRDISWALKSFESWPFTSKVIDWDKVQKLAEVEPAVH
jgi:hypothetical protein